MLLIFRLIATRLAISISTNITTRTFATKAKQSIKPIKPIKPVKPKRAAESTPTKVKRSKAATSVKVKTKTAKSASKKRSSKASVKLSTSTASISKPVKPRRKRTSKRVNTMSSALSQQIPSASVNKPPRAKPPSKSKAKASVDQDSATSSLSRSTSVPVRSPSDESSTSLSSRSLAPDVPPPTTFFCYLLRSDSPRHNGATYIGFTTNPVRRLRQHNGDISAGARKTSFKRPWSMIACVRGFPTKIAALQFEWQWTYPKKSRRLKTLMSSGRRWTAGTKGKIELLYALVSSNPWSHLPLHIRFTSQTYYNDYHNVVMKRSDRELAALERAMELKSHEKRAETMLAHHIYQLPSHIDVSAGPLTELDMYVWLESRRKRVPKSSSNASASVDDADDDLMADNIFDDDSQVSGEESHDSDDGEAVEPGWDENFDTPDPVSDIIDDVHTGVDSAASRQRCIICLNQKSMNSRSRMFITECPHCHNSVHVVCAASHILTNMPQSSYPAQSLPISSSLPASPFASIPNSVPLIPPLSTGLCPSCHSLWNWPSLMDRCRSMFVDSKNRRGGDTFYRVAGGSSAMTQLMKEFAGRQPAESPALEAKKKVAKPRKRKAVDSPVDLSADQSTLSFSPPGSEPFPATQPVPSQPARRRIDMADPHHRPPSDQSRSLSPQSLKRSLMANAASKRLAARSPRAATTEIIDSPDSEPGQSRASPPRRSLSLNELSRKQVIDVVDGASDTEPRMLTLRERLAKRKKATN